MSEAIQIKVLRKLVGKTKIVRIRSQQIRESCNIQTINEFVERRRKKWSEHLTKMDAERLIKISSDNIFAGKNISWTSEKKTERLNP